MICSTVNVAVKIRPLDPYDVENGSKICVAVVQGKEKIQVVGSEKSYRFDHVFGPDVNNENFYNSIIRNKVAEIFNDRDVTILAYGQRRSGKTHTMGTNNIGEENMGIIPRAIDTLFDIINSNTAQKYKVTVTFTEIYNKELYDLLASNKEGTERIVKMKKNGSNDFGLTESQVTNVETAMQCLVKGSQKRVTSQKKGNSQSTRSHAIFTITIYQRTNVDPRIITTSKLHLVDLAGSKHTNKNGKKAKVNKDLLAIKNWINHEQKEKSDSYTKYQSSKLTIFLRESLRENSMVLIIACLSPADYCLVETLQTLRYANSLRKIKRDFSANQTNPVVNKIATKMDTNLIEAKPNLINNLEVQQSMSNMDIQESEKSETNDSMKAEGILDAKNLSNCSRIDQLDWFQEELNIDTENPQKILTTQNSSKSRDIMDETLEDEVEDDWEASLIRNALKSNGSSPIQQKKFQIETGDDVEAKRILNAGNSSKSSINKQELLQSKVENDSVANDLVPDVGSSIESCEIERAEFERKLDDRKEVQKNLDILESNKSIEIENKMYQRQMQANSEVESIQNVQKLIKSSKTEQEKIQMVPDHNNELQEISDALKSRKSSSTFDQEMVESETDDNTEAEHIPDALQLNTSNNNCKEMFQTKMDNAADADRIQNILELSRSNKSEQKIIQSKTNAANEEQTILDAFVYNKTSKSATETVQTKMDEKTDAEKIQDILESNKVVQVKRLVQIEIGDKTTAQSFKNILKSTKYSNFEHRIDPSKTNVNTEMIQDVLEPNKSNKTEQKMFKAKMDDVTKAESFQSAQKSSKFNQTQRENNPTEMIEDSPTKLFSKIADFFLEPSPTEEEELRKEIHNLRKKLRDRTAKLKTNIMDDLSLHKSVEVSTTRRENAKLVVTKILEEFQEVLTYIVENSEIRDWIERVFRRIRDLLDEQKKIAGKMLNCEAIDDEAMDEKYAEHTMRQVDKYHELQGVNRCIALLEELVASLPKESITIGDILKNLENTSNQIKKLEIEKVDFVKVLKCAEPLNESRILAEYGIDKVLEMDEKISRLWRRRIKQMIAVERRQKFDQQIANMSAQIETLKTARVRLVQEMKDEEKRWNSASTYGEKKKIQNIAKTKKTKNSKVLRKCACKLNCLSRRCSCVKSGISCINCNCNAELCQNSDKENNTRNVSNNSRTFLKLPTNTDLKCACATDCSNRRCTCGKNGITCNDNCKCKPQFCKNKSKENGTTETNFNELQVPSTSTDDKMEVDRGVSSLHVNSCVCRENGATCINCNRSFKLREYKAKARRRLFADIDHENEGNEESRKRPRLGA